MVDFLTLMQHTFRKFQLKAEIALLDRDSTNRQRAFGVELYDLIERQRRQIRQQIIDENSKNKSNNDNNTNNNNNNSDPTTKTTQDVEQLLRVFQTIENAIRVPLEVCRKEVDDMEASTPKFPPIFIQRRKEEFGITIWPIVSEPQWLHESLEKDLTALAAAENNKDKTIGDFMTTALQGVVKGTKTTLTKAIGKFSPEEREVEACVDVAKRDISVFEELKTEKLLEIERLVSGGTTLECC